MTSLPRPDWWQFVLLALAAFRVYRLIARDTITADLRAAFTYPDDVTVELGERPTETIPWSAAGDGEAQRIVVVGEDEQPKAWRVYLSTLIRCPWCQGFYMSVAWWALWAEWPRATTFAATPLAISAVLALIAKTDT